MPLKCLRLKYSYNEESNLRLWDWIEMESIMVDTLWVDKPGPFVKFLQEHEIVAQYTMPSSLDHNCVAEIINQTLMDMVRSMRSHATLPFLNSCELKHLRRLCI